MLTLALPPLVLARTAPQSVFWNEFVAVAMLVSAAVAFKAFQHSIAVPRLVTVFVTIAFVAATLVGGHSRTPFAVGFAAYAVVFVVAYVLAARTADDARDAAQSNRMALVVATGFVFLACFQSIVGAFQIADVTFGGLVLPKVYRQTYGNVGQPNHYASLLSLGIVGAWYLGVCGYLRRAVVAVLILWLACSLAASASRACWLYFACVVMLGLWSAYRSDASDRKGAVALAWVGVAVLMLQVAIAKSGALEWVGLTSSVARAADVGSNGQRLYDWSLALSAIKAHPWLGVGVGGFHGWAVEQMPATPVVPFSKFAEHAHNLPLHLAATMGVPFALVFLGAVGSWLLRQLCAKMSADRLFAFSGLAVIGLHSIVEYPLWYTYFVIPAGLLCGLLAATDSRARIVRLPVALANAALAGVVLALVWVARDYVFVQRAYDDWATVRNVATAADRERIRREVERVPAWSIFGDHAESLALQTWAPDVASAARMVAQCEPAFRLRPSWGLGTQCLLAMGMAGDRAGVARMSLVLCEGFPRHHQMLREWAEGADRFHPAVSVQSENCLRKS
ncbi:Wzy polymerase domain-containing protein [Niveibacterium sp.]|uniref:PglL family O-oligosaccharyltransferase n=1 Tax=Niveibacterium sp. TaxID=2017444 RepID=UPI0035B188EA